MVRIIDFPDGFTSASAPSVSPIFSVGNVESIAASGTITLVSTGDQILKVQGDAAPVSASLTPFGTTPPSNGSIIKVIGQDNTNTVQLTHNDAADGCILNGNAILGENDSIELMYDSNIDRYVEQNRNF